MSYKKSSSWKIFMGFNYVLLSVVALVCLFPMLHILAVSLSEGWAVQSGMVGIWPVKFTFKAYEFVMNKPEFADKVVIITGASSGIGKACAFEFAANGSKVVLAARNEDELLKVKNSIINLGGEASFKKTDVRSIDDCKDLINNVVEKYGKIDILVNNAGISMRASFEDLDLQIIKEMMDTNFYGADYRVKLVTYLQVTGRY